MYARDHAPELRDHVAAIEIDYGDGRPLGINVAGADQRLAPILQILHTVAEPMGGVVRVSDSPGADLEAINQAGVPAIAPLQDCPRLLRLPS